MFAVRNLIQRSVQEIPSAMFDGNWAAYPRILWAFRYARPKVLPSLSHQVQHHWCIYHILTELVWLVGGLLTVVLIRLAYARVSR